MYNYFIDFHCHPSLKPYGKSFDLPEIGQNTSRRRQRNSMWFYDSPDLLEKALQTLTGIVKFTQADCTTLAYGNVQVICASLYPIERGFFNNDLGDGFLSDLAATFITSVGKARVNYIQQITNYFEDVQGEYEFYRQLDGVSVRTDAGDFKYILISSFTDVENYLQQNPEDKKTIFIAMTIEGLHVLHNNIDAEPDRNAILENLRSIKNWQHPPFFVTFAHHFYNHFCGHAQSLTDLVGSKTDQSDGMFTGFTALGKDVLLEALSKQSGKRIYIDIKHMSATSRKEYMQILETEFANDKIPLIVSHGAANGLRSMDEPVPDNPDTAFKLLAADINFYDNELLAIAKSGGIFGLQLDERRVASPSTLRDTKHSIAINKIRHYRAELLWNQLQHIAELLDKHDMFAWNCIAIGSDFDGIINPLNGYLTAETLVHLQEYTERHAHNYMSGRGLTALKSYNQISASEIVTRVFYTNGREFMKNWFV